MQTRINVLHRKATIYKVSEIFPFVKLYYYEQNEIFLKMKNNPKTNPNGIAINSFTDSQNLNFP